MTNPHSRIRDTKDPDSTQRYGWDLRADIGDATVTAKEIADTTGGVTVAVGSLVEDGGQFQCLVEGGAVTGPGDPLASVTLRYSTDDGRVDIDETIKFRIAHR